MRHHIACQLRGGGEGHVLPIDRVRGDLDPLTFRDRYLRPAAPVVLEKAAADWVCGRTWSFDMFKQRFGSESIKLVQRKGLSDDDFIDEREFTEEMVFGDFLNQVLAGGRKYMRFSPLLEKFPELRDDFDRQFFRRMSGNNLGISYSVFIGAEGTLTPLHNNISPFFFVNVQGVKRWVMVPPRFLPVLNPSADVSSYSHSDADLNVPMADQYPGLESVDRFETVLGPGDILFVPPWMWHSVQNKAATIGVRCGFIDPLGMMMESPCLAFIRIFAARNPSLPRALYMAFFQRNLVERDKWLISPGWWRV